MNGKMGVVTNDVVKVVDQIIKYLDKDIKFSMPLALGKPMLLANEFYRRAKADATFKLQIITALPLEKPRGHSDIEKRFLVPLAARIFDGVPEFDFMRDFREGKLPKNVEIFEFFSKAGANLNYPEAQMRHFSSNYTHSVRDAVEYGCNVFAQMLSVRNFKGKDTYSMGSNTDTSYQAVHEYVRMRKEGIKCVTVGEANINMPYMYGDAIVDKNLYDFILQGDQYNYTLFGAPKDPVAPADHMLGINVSTLIKDGGTIQVGIGALGDAIGAGLIMRNEHNAVYREVIEKAGLLSRYGTLIKKWGDTGVFKKGLYGSSEMFVDVFMQMYKSKILKRKVYDSIPIMKLITQGELATDKIPADIIDKLLKMKAIKPKLEEDDFKFLTEYGILKDGVTFTKTAIKDGKTSYPVDLSNKANLTKIRKILGKELKGGHIILGAFFLGPKAFYKALNDMPEDERKQFEMSGVEKVNQLYGNEELRTLQRTDGRFVNTGMNATLLGAISSDTLHDGRVVSGIGGQYNFVSMAHALNDGRLIMMIKSTKGFGKTLKSNITFSYASCSVPRHLRDIIVTEYGIADVRSKPDAEVIAEMLKVADSRFQKELLEQAKKAGKIPKDYQIPEEYRNNYPEKIIQLLQPYREKGYFQPFPFGTDLTIEEMMLGASLKGMKAIATGDPLKLLTGLLKEMFRPVPASAAGFIKRMNLENPANLKEKITRKMIIFALRNSKMIK